MNRLGQIVAHALANLTWALNRLTGNARKEDDPVTPPEVPQDLAHMIRVQRPTVQPDNTTGPMDHWYDLGPRRHIPTSEWNKIMDAARDTCYPEGDAYGDIRIEPEQERWWLILKDPQVRMIEITVGPVSYPLNKTAPAVTQRRPARHLRAISNG